MAARKKVSPGDLEKEVWWIKDGFQQASVFVEDNWDTRGRSPIGDINNGCESTWGPPDFALKLRAKQIGKSIRHCFVRFDNFYISEDFRAIIEKHEPNVHKYIPVTIHSKTESVQYYILHVMGLIDGVVIEQSIGKWDDPKIHQELTEPRFFIETRDDCLAYSSRTLGQNKVWRDKRYITRRRIFVTGPIKADLAALKRHNIKFTRVNVVDANVTDTTSLLR